MSVIKDFWTHGHTAQHLLAFALVAATGLALSRLQFRKLGLGIAGVLFAGLILGHLGVSVDHHVLEFVREFGLILFVFSIGLQLGPGFFSSFRKAGLKLNLLAMSNVLLGVLVCLVLVYAAGLSVPVAAGLLSGATTNTPSLAAAQQALVATGVGETEIATHGTAYALAYPFGVFGVILSMIAAKRFPQRKQSERNELREVCDARLGLSNLKICNPGLSGQKLSSLVNACGGIVVSRLLRGGTLSVPTPDTRLERDDCLLVVGKKECLEKARMLTGAEAGTDLRTLEGPITARRMIVTHKEVVGKSFEALQLHETCGTVPTRLMRNGMEFLPEARLRVQFGDVLTLVGTSRAIEDAGKLLGDSPKELEHTRVGPLFFGILLGVLVGMIPIPLPGIPAPVRLGLAGGPLLVAILLGRLGSLGPIVWYVPANASLALREIGIVLFLACVGLKSGDLFFEYLLNGQGLVWMALGTAITFIPVLLTAWVGRRLAGLSLPETCGLLAGSMTDPPALAYAQQTHQGNDTSVAYATVYPLTMLLRVLTAQVLVFFLR